jgi:hypothetical protein
MVHAMLVQSSPIQPNNIDMNSSNSPFGVTYTPEASISSIRYPQLNQEHEIFVDVGFLLSFDSPCNAGEYIRVGMSQTGLVVV